MAWRESIFSTPLVFGIWNILGFLISVEGIDMSNYRKFFIPII